METGTAEHCQNIRHILFCSAGSIPSFVRYRSIPEFCSILDTYVVHLVFTQNTVPSRSTVCNRSSAGSKPEFFDIDQYIAGSIPEFFDINRYSKFTL